MGDICFGLPLIWTLGLGGERSLSFIRCCLSPYCTSVALTLKSKTRPHYAWVPSWFHLELLTSTERFKMRYRQGLSWPRHPDELEGRLATWWHFWIVSGWKCGDYGQVWKSTLDFSSRYFWIASALLLYVTSKQHRESTPWIEQYKSRTTERESKTTCNCGVRSCAVEKKSLFSFGDHLYLLAPVSS